MKFRTLVYESSCEWETLINYIGENTLLDPILYISTSRCADIHVHTWDQPSYRKSSFTGISRQVYDQVIPRMYQFIDMYCRNLSPVLQSSYRNWTIHKYVNIFNILLEEITHLLVKNRVEVILLARIPHLGSDFLLAIIGEALGLKVIILQQFDICDNRFFIYAGTKELGLFKNAPIIYDTKETLELTLGFEHNWPYMTDIKCFKSRLATSRLRFAFTFFYDVKNAFKRRTSNSVFYDFCHKYILHKQEQRYLKHIIICSTTDPQLESRFIYFPLHLQPEMTTSMLGGDFADQALAIERLSERLPAGWNIFVKENPRQSAFMRDDGFFARLQNIDAVTLVSPDVPSHILMEKSALVATISGTAGWEAISGGKPVLVFGEPWYREYPGVISYRDDIDLMEISRLKPEPSHVQVTMTQMLSKMGRGRVYGHIEHLELMRSEKNSREVADSLQRYLIASLNT